MISSSPADILSNIGNDLRGPVNGVLGFAALLHSTPLSPEQREYLDHLTVSAQSILAQVNLILDLARLENHTLELEPSSVSFSELIQESTLLAQRAAPEKSIQLHHRIDPNIPSRIRVDRQRVQQILSHLLENLIRFTHHGVIELNASLESTPHSISSNPSPGHHSLVIQIRKPGGEIPSEFHPEVLKAFQTGNTSSLRRQGGIGVGLTFSRKLVHLMGGQIGFESLPQQGTRFWFTLPLHISATSENETARVLAPHHTPIPTSTPTTPPIPTLPTLSHQHTPDPTRVLIVEDNTATARYLKQAVARLGCHVSIAHTLDEARTHQKQSAFHILILDSDLQGQNGLALASEWADPFPSDRSSPPPTPPTIIAMSHDPIPSHQQQALMIHSVLLKPLNTPQLLEAVQACLNKAHRTPTAW